MKVKNLKHNAYEGTLTFIDHHIPALEAGKYKVQVNQKAKIKDNEQSGYGATTEFVVSAPRFKLDQTLIHSHFPTKGAHSDFDGVVASISFERPTLPWERSPDIASGTSDGAAWLALLLVDEEDYGEGRVMESNVNHLKDVEASLGLSDLHSWHLYDENMPVDLLKLDQKFFKAIVPKYGDLQWLSHSRQNHSPNQKEGELTCVLCNRLPTPGKMNTVYLVSIEHRYENNNKDTEPTIIGDGMQQLVWLYKWQFFCKPAMMYSYTVTEKILHQAKDKFPTLILPNKMPEWVEHEYEGETGLESLKEMLANKDEILGIDEAAKNYIIEKCGQKNDATGEIEYQLTPKILIDAKKKHKAIKLTESIENISPKYAWISKAIAKKIEANKTAEKPVVIKLPDVAPRWVTKKYVGEDGRKKLEDLLLGNHLVHDISEDGKAFIIKKSKKAEGTFEDILEAVEAGTLLEKPILGKTIKNPAAQALLANGRTVLKHHLRSGGKTFSWFKGALSPFQEKDRGFEFPVNSSDDLLIFNQATGMLDTTYSAAWALGRVKGLEKKELSTELFKWRHNQRHQLMLEDSTFDHSHLHLEPPANAELPENIVHQLDLWKLLEGIPFEYLIPKPHLLPNESLRFFHLDSNWIRAFIDGFFSVGKVHGLDDKREEYEQLPGFDKPITGILLRSDVVAGWPAMHIDAHAERFEGNKYSLDPKNILPVLRKEFLQTEVMIMLFEGVPKTIDVYLSPEALHSGFDRHDKSGDTKYMHRVCHPVTGNDLIFEESTRVPAGSADSHSSVMGIEALAFKSEQPDYRIFSASDAADKFEKEINKYFNKYPDTGISTPFKLSPGYFGLELIDGAPMVRFQLEELDQRQVIQAVSPKPAVSVPTATSTSPPTPVEKTPEKKAPVKKPKAPSKKDNLKVIEGIGPKTEKALHAAGIYTYSDLGKAKISRLKEIMAKAKSNLGSHDPTTWPKQAKLAAKGQFDKLEKLKEDLHRGEH